jgi:hypothetical protein
MDINSIRAEIESAGLAFRGVFHPVADDEPPMLSDGRAAETLVLVGFAGKRGWPAFSVSSEAHDGQLNPLDRWSRRIVSGLAASVGATPFFPFGGPPWLPFLRWARRAEPQHPSPLGLLIHPDWGLWHSYRGLLAFGDRLDLPPADLRPSPCDSCADKPCLSACPVGAFVPGRYDVPVCKAHIGTPAGSDCMEEGCRARRACPVGATTRYGPEEAAFHMRAFRGSNP